MKIKFFTTATLLVLSIFSVMAEDVKTLSLKDAQEIALKHHPKISVAELAYLAAKEGTRETQSAYYPVINAEATAVDATANNTRIAAGGLNNPLILTRQGDGVNVSQLITDFGRTLNLSASSKLHARAVEQNVFATRAQILLALNAAYFDALQAQSVLEVAKQTVATRQLTFDQISELASNSLKSGLDVSFAGVNLGEGKLLLASAQNDLQATFERLSNLLGDREKRTYHLLENSAPVTTPADASMLVQTALKNRPDLVQLRYEREASEKFVRAEKDLRYPTVNAFGAAGVSPFHDSSMRDNYAAAGVNFSLPIFDGFLFSARTETARLREKSFEESLRDAENNVIRDVRVAVLNLDYAGERMALTEQLLKSARDAFDLAQARYKVGSSSIVELSQAQLNETQAQIGEARAKYDYQVRSAVLNYETGQLQ